MTGASQLSGIKQSLLNGGITHTRALIEVLNGCERWVEEDGMSEWFRSCVRWFAEEPMASLTQAEVEEYTLLGELKVQCQISKELLINWFHSICEKMEGRYGENKLVKCIDAALQVVDLEIFEGDPSCLIRLADDLLEKVATGKTTLTKETYPTHGLALFALQQSLIVADQVAAKQLNKDDENGVHQRFCKRLRQIAEEQQHYYPFCFQAMTIEQGILSMEMNGTRSTVTCLCRRLCHCAYGILCAIEGARALILLEFSHGAFETAIMSLSAAADTGAIKPALWYYHLLQLNRMALTCIAQPERFTEFEEHLRSKIEVAATMQKRDKVALRYGIIDRLRMLVTHSPTAEIRSKALETLLSLGERALNKDSLMDGWAEDVEIFEALLDALFSVFGCVEKEQAAAISAALEVMISVDASPTVQRKIQEWLGDQTLRDKLTMRTEKHTVVQSEHLLHLATKYVGSTSPSESIKKFRAELRRRYQDPDFATVPAIFDGVPAKHVKNFRQQLMLLEKKETAGDDDTDSIDTEEHQSVTYYERIKLSKVPITHRDLFSSRNPGTKSSKPVRSVLIVGNPGTGKTSLSRKLAYHWSMGEWGTEFVAVYVLPVRKLRKDDYDDRVVRRERTLATALTNICFDRRNKDTDFANLRSQVDTDLGNRSTLLIVDGLDEGQGACDEILRQAKYCESTILLLSRPYRMHDEHQLVDIEVECIGFNDRQLISYINTELAKEKALLLEQFLKANQAVWDIAHVPVNAHIVCYLWKERAEILIRDRVNGSLLNLYRSITHFVWDRFVDKYDIKDASRADVFGKLGEVGFDALEQGQILISQELVHEHVEDSRLESIVKSCAFLLLELSGSDYQFPHLTFQEYFAGCHLALKFVEGSCQEKKTVETFVSKNKYFGEFRVMFLFMTEEVVRREGLKGFEKILLILDKGRDILGYQHCLLKLSVVESFLAVTRKKGKHDSRILESAEPVVKAVVDFFGVLMNQRTLRSLVAEAIERAPNVCQSFPKHAQPLRGRSRNGRTVTPERKNVKRRTNQPSQTSTPSCLTPSTISKDDASMNSLSIAVMKAAKQKMRNAEKNHGEPELRLRIPLDLKDKLSCSSREENLSLNGFMPQETCHEDTVNPEAFVDQLLANYYGSCASSRMAAVSQVAKIIKKHPQRADELIDLVSCSLLDEVEYVHRAAVREASIILKLPMEPSNAMMDLSLQSYGVGDVGLRLVAVKKIPRLIDACPQRAEELIHLISRALDDEHEIVRSQVVKRLPESLNMVLPYSSAAQDILLKLYRSGARRDRVFAVKHISRVIDAHPECASVLQKLLKEACTDQQEDVRQAVAQQISETLKDASKITESSLSMLTILGEDESVKVRDTLMAGITTVSIVELIDLYWEHACPIVIKFIVPKLFHIALTVRGGAEKQQWRLTLHSTPSDYIQWEKPRSDVGQFIRSIRGEVKRTFPGIRKR